MSNHSKRATLRTASGAQIESAGQKMVECENGGGRLVAVSELQKCRMTVVMSPHGSILTRGQVMKPLGSNLD